MTTKLTREPNRSVVPADVQTKLYVIKQRDRHLYWACSTEHGSGWTGPYPKQSFTKSELSKEIFRLIDHGWFVDCEVLELFHRFD